MREAFHIVRLCFEGLGYVCFAAVLFVWSITRLGALMERISEERF